MSALGAIADHLQSGTGGETCEVALTHIENVIAMILAEMAPGGV